MHLIFWLLLLLLQHQQEAFHQFNLVLLTYIHFQDTRQLLAQIFLGAKWLVWYLSSLHNIIFIKMLIYLQYSEFDKQKTCQNSKMIINTCYINDMCIYVYLRRIQQNKIIPNYNIYNRKFEAMMPSPNYESLIEFKFDLSFIQSGLTQALTQLSDRITQLETKNMKIEQKIQTQFLKINHQIDHQVGNLLERKLTEINGFIRKFENLQTRIQDHGNRNTNTKSHTEVLNSTKQRISLNSQSKDSAQINANGMTPNAGQTDSTVNCNIEEQLDSQGMPISIFDKKGDEIYMKIIQKVQKQIKLIRTDIQNQFSRIDLYFNNLEITHTALQRKNVVEKSVLSVTKQTQKMNMEQRDLEQQQKINQHEAHNQSLKLQQLDNSLRHILDGNLTKQNMIDFVTQAQKKLKDQILQINQEEIADIKRANSVYADHLVQLKKDIQQLMNTTDAIKIEVNGTSDRGSEVHIKVASLTDTVTYLREMIKSLQNNMNNMNKLIEETKNENSMEDITNKQNLQENQNSKTLGLNRKDSMRDSRTNLRSSLLAPIRASEITKQTNNRFEAVEENYQKISVKLQNLIERFNKIEDDRKRFGDGQGFLPKIEKEGKSNINHYQLIKKDIKATNQQINQSNQRILAMKQKLNAFYESHASIPNKIEDLYIKLREYNEFQEDRLIQLIKELINRMLSDPFDNHFTNRLKREINVKFLEIKHEYYTILKQIQSKVQDRAQKKQLDKVIYKFEQTIVELKALNAKKCEIEDFKKGVKYLENRIKDVFQFTKNETTNLYNEQKQYIGGKKQSIQ